MVHSRLGTSSFAEATADTSWASAGELSGSPGKEILIGVAVIRKMLIAANSLLKDPDLPLLNNTVAWSKQPHYPICVRKCAPSPVNDPCKMFGKLTSKTTEFHTATTQPLDLRMPALACGSMCCQQS